MRRLILSVLVIATVAGLAATYENSSLQVARTEVQLAADGAALAGAGIFAIDPYNQAAARAEAKGYAELNFVRGERVSLAPEDIELIPEEGIVRVTVRASLAPANAAQRLLWVLLGIRGSTIEASAAAEAIRRTQTRASAQEAEAHRIASKEKVRGIVRGVPNRQS